MPELPEVEVLCRSFDKVARDTTITAVKSFRPNLRIPIPAKKELDLLVGRKIKKIYRQAKYMIINTGELSAIFHFGMSGNLFHETSSNPIWPHTHVMIGFQKNKSTKGYMHYSDPRRFGLFTICPSSEIKNHKLFNSLGPDPLKISDLSEYLFLKSRKSNTSLKNFLMNSKILVGVGNIYANEALFRSRLHPSTFPSKVTSSSYLDLSKNIQSVLKEAIKKGGTTIKDYKGSDGKAGYFSINLKVYGRGGEPCSACRTKIESYRISNRATYYCPSCQMPQ